MTLMGTVHKTGALLLLLLISASMTWSMVFSPGVDGQLVVSGPVGLLTIGGAIGGLIFAMATIFKPRWAPVTAVTGAHRGLKIVAMAKMSPPIAPPIVSNPTGPETTSCPSTPGLKTMLQVIEAEMSKSKSRAPVLCTVPMSVIRSSPVRSI